MVAVPVVPAVLADREEEQALAQARVVPVPVLLAAPADRLEDREVPVAAVRVAA